MNSKIKSTINYKHTHFYLMIRKSDYIEQIDKYLNKELEQPELSFFEVQVDSDSDLAEDINLIKEIDTAVNETEILALRKNIDAILSKDEQNNECFNYEPFCFALSEEISSSQKMENQLELEKIINSGHSFPKIHLYQHRIAGKETIHQLYKDQLNTDSENNPNEFSSSDEELFSDIQLALDENEIIDIRANLKQIALNIPDHQYSTQDLDDYVYGNMDSEQKKLFEMDLCSNQNLIQDVSLVKDIDLAWLEKDVMDLRVSLSQIQKSQIENSENLEIIEGYIYQELSDEQITAFEAKLAENNNLSNEIELIKGIDFALNEDDVIKLRNNLQQISLNAQSIMKTEQSFITKFKKNRIIISAIAASLLIILAITSLMPGKSSHNELYQKFYSTYQTSGINRSSELSADKTMAIALVNFDNRQYDTSINLLKKVIDTDQNNMVGHFYYGMALQETKKYQDAIAQYQTVIKNNNNLFIDQAYWYIGLCYLKTNENKKAYNFFKNIADKNGFYSSSAQIILQKMKYSE